MRKTLEDVFEEAVEYFNKAAKTRPSKPLFDQEFAPYLDDNATVFSISVKRELGDAHEPHSPKNTIATANNRPGALDYLYDQLSDQPHFTLPPRPPAPGAYNVERHNATQATIRGTGKWQDNNDGNGRNIDKLTFKFDFVRRSETDEWRFVRLFGEG